MNYEKKRKRQNSRQSSKVFLGSPFIDYNSQQIKIYEQGVQDGVRKTIKQLIDDGLLNADDFNLE